MMGDRISMDIGAMLLAKVRKAAAQHGAADRINPAAVARLVDAYQKLQIIGDERRDYKGIAPLLPHFFEEFEVERRDVHEVRIDERGTAYLTLITLDELSAKCDRKAAFLDLLDDIDSLTCRAESEERIITTVTVEGLWEE